ncbi:alcohol dehydrogenase catalytic domain-containing protein [Streptomyces sp. MA15]|uniref:zinc-dependent alcohol dehydrogenase n=1 Tax=Streptomyces sp. MA15 TaxID=3055061 RepID=UPI0025B19A79|nr:alcohol dehydrogenase catalytic domain-containing protein [Streptomyces sp. MA15]MDN3270174.1 alcohol dehydrogenase catalytic domain-containing protein [Streptomyces sp. MA15]
MTPTGHYTAVRASDMGPAKTSSPGPGEVELVPAYVGVCDADLPGLHRTTGSRLKRPAVLGHEMSGLIVQAGPGVRAWQPGDAVTVMPLRWDSVCPVCRTGHQRTCRAGHQHTCRHLDFIGVDSPGAMQQRWTVPAATLVRLPPAVPLRSAALVVPTAVAVHDISRADVRSGDRVLVVGGGPVGLLIALVARAAGADTRIVEPSSRRRQVAADLQLIAWDPAMDNVAALIARWTGPTGPDVTFAVSGTTDGLVTVVDALPVRGRLCLVATHPKPCLANLRLFFQRELTLANARTYHLPDYTKALALIEDGTVPADKLISKVIPLTAVASEFESSECADDVMKILVDCGGDAGTRT